MMSRVRFSAACCLVLLMLAAPAVAALDLTQWRTSISIQVEPSAAGYADVPLTGEVFARSSISLRDLRIVSDTGKEIPYVLKSWPGADTVTAVSADLLNLSVRPRRLTRFELHTARTGQPHNRIRLEIEDANFSRPVTAEGSDDRRTWLMLTQATIYRFTEGTAVDHTTVSYPQSLYRYVRLTIQDDGKPGLTVRGAELFLQRVEPARVDRWFHGVVRVDADVQRGTSTMLIDLQHPNLPMSKVDLTVAAPPLFARTVQVDTSDDGTTWSPSGIRTVIRGPGVTPATAVTVAFPETRGRFVRLTVVNEDNAPLQVSRASVYGVRRTLLFPTDRGRRYTLYTGHPDAPAPSYDLAEVLRLQPTLPRAVPASLRPAAPNPAYEPPMVRRPWTEEHPQVLWGTLGGTILILIILILRTAKSIGTAP